MQLYWDEQTASGTLQTVWQCFTVNASVFLCRLPACGRATIFNKQPPVRVSPQTNIFISCFCWRRACVRYALLLLWFPHDGKRRRRRLLQRHWVSVIWQKKNKKIVPSRCSPEVEISLLETGSPQKLKYTVCMQFTNMKVLIKKIFTFFSSLYCIKLFFVLK